MDSKILIIIVICIALYFVFGIIIWASRFKKVLPNQIMVISGRRYRRIKPDGEIFYRNSRIIKGGGGTFVYPVIEKAAFLSLEAVPVIIRIKDVFSKDRISFDISISLQVKIKDNDDTIDKAIELFISGGKEEILRFTTEHTESLIGKMIEEHTFEDLNAERYKISEDIKNECAIQFAQFGLEILSLKISDITRNNII